MNVQKTKKLNSMIEQLTKHGCVFDPYETANSLYDDAVPKIENTNIQISADTADKTKKDATTMNNGQVNYLIDLKLERFKREISAIMESKIQMLMASSNALGREAQKKNTDTKGADNQVQTNMNDSKKPRDNPRSGSFASSDVSIDKIFYCGQK